MEEEHKHLFVRVLEATTGILAVTTAVVLASVAGVNTYLAYQPSSLVAQSISAADASVNSTTASTACQQAIATAAARGTPDTQSVITDQTSLQFEDHCVAAVLNPSTASQGPNNPASYMCVGKSAKVNVAATGLITETAVPDPAVPAGTCATIACGAPGATGQSSCFAANNLTSLNGSNIQSTLGATQQTITSDPGITSFTLNADGSIANVSGNTASVLDSGAGDANLAGNTASLDQAATAPQSAINTAPGEPPAIGETQAVAPQPPQTELPSVAQTPTTPTAETTIQPEQVATPQTSPSAPTETTPAATTQSSAVETNVPQQSLNTDISGPQATSPTINTGPTTPELTNTVNTGSPELDSLINQPAQPQTWVDKIGSTLGNDTITVVNDVRSFFGFPPINSGPMQIEGPVNTIGIRG